MEIICKCNTIKKITFLTIKAIINRTIQTKIKYIAATIAIIIAGTIEISHSGEGIMIMIIEVKDNTLIKITGQPI